MFENLNQLMYAVIYIGILAVLWRATSRKLNGACDIFWGLLCTVLYLATGAVYRPLSVFMIYAMTAFAILFGGSRLIPLILFIMLTVHLWVLVIGPVEKPED